MTRRPPSLLGAEVDSRERLTSQLTRVTLRGQDLTRLEPAVPAASVRVLLPDPDDPHRLELPGWDGNRFVLPGGGRPNMRTLTPRFHDRGRGRLSLFVVVHGAGPASQWAAAAPVGSPVAVAGPARGYQLDPAAGSLILGCDAAALAAVGQIIESAGEHVVITVVAEAEPGSPLPGHRGPGVRWVPPDPVGPSLALARTLGEMDLPAGTRLWAAGEAAAMQQLRRRLYDDRRIPRSRATVRGYWKHGRAEGGLSDPAVDM